MSYHYTSDARASAPYSLPNIEVFWVKEAEWWYDENGERCDAPEYFCPICEGEMSWSSQDRDVKCEPCNRVGEAPEAPCEQGFYYWFCLPGCMPDSEPDGPYDTEEEALAAARELAGDDE